MTISKETAFNTLVDDVAHAVFSQADGPDDLFEHREIVGRLAASAPTFPPLYRDSSSDPLLQTFMRIGPEGWRDVLQRDRDLQGFGLLGLDLVQTQTQRADGYKGQATKALQEVVSDLYDGFLSAADRDGVKPPDHGVAAPLVKWGRPGFGPYAFTAPAARLYGCEAGLVNMPPAFADGGLAAWAALGHETAGHEVLHADAGLREELAEAVHDKIMESGDEDLKDKAIREKLATYWSERIDETASDVMGIVNMGPAAALGLIAYFRGLSRAAGGSGQLSPVGQAAGVHPAPLARGWIMVEALRHCSFRRTEDTTTKAGKGRKKTGPDWVEEIMAEVNLDIPANNTLWLAGHQFTADAVRASARSTATAILMHKAKVLEGHALIEIQDWRKHDQQIVEMLAIHTILGGTMPPQSAFGGIFAAHAVAAAIIATLISGDPSGAQSQMIELAAEMHDANPSWSALNIGSRGDFGGVNHATGGQAFGLFPRRGGRSGGNGNGGGDGNSGGRAGPAVPVLAGGPAVPVLAGGPAVPVLAGGPAVPVTMAEGGLPTILSSDGRWTLHQDPSVIRSAIGASLHARTANWILESHGIGIDNTKITIDAKNCHVSSKMAQLLIGSSLG